MDVRQILQRHELTECPELPTWFNENLVPILWKRVRELTGCPTWNFTELYQMMVAWYLDPSAKHRPEQFTTLRNIKNPSNGDLSFIRYHFKCQVNRFVPRVGFSRTFSQEMPTEPSLLSRSPAPPTGGSEMLRDDVIDVLFAKMQVHRYCLRWKFIDGYSVVDIVSLLAAAQAEETWEGPRNKKITASFVYRILIEAKRIYIEALGRPFKRSSSQGCATSEDTATQEAGEREAPEIDPISIPQ